MDWKIDVLKSSTAQRLNALGFMPYQDVFWYLLAGIDLLNRQPQLLANVNKLLYGEIAAACSVSKATVEKAIRLGIRRSWQSGKLAPLRPYLQQPDQQPKNTAFLTAVLLWTIHDKAAAGVPSETI